MHNTYPNVEVPAANSVCADSNNLIMLSRYGKGSLHGLDIIYGHIPLKNGLPLADVLLTKTSNIHVLLMPRWKMTIPIWYYSLFVVSATTVASKIHCLSELPM